MTTLERMRVAWSGNALIGAGVSTFYFREPAGARPSDVRTFLANHTLDLPSGVTIQVPNSGDIIDEASGQITGSWTSGTLPAVITGANTAAFSLGVGFQVRWQTGGIVGGRRVVGSTFIVPCAQGDFGTDGRLTSGLTSTWQAAGAALIAAAPGLCVYSRPKDAWVDKKGRAHPARVGVSSLVTACTVPNHPTWLRSRRK